MIVGSEYSITTRFFAVDGALTDPDTVTALIERPDGSQDTPTPTSTATGIWITEGPTDQAGIWFYQITGLDPDGDVVDAGSFCVDRGLT